MIKRITLVLISPLIILVAIIPVTVLGILIVIDCIFHKSARTRWREQW